MVNSPIIHKSLNVYAANNRTSKNMRHKNPLIKLKEKIDYSTIIAILTLLVINRTVKQ